MPRSAVPQHVLDRDWKGTDNASWLMRMKKRIQYVFAAGPNVPSGFWKWRDIPKTLFKLRNKHEWHSFRFENTDGSVILHEDNAGTAKVYLSRIQPWCRWHVSLQWPLFFNCHIIYRTRDVVKYPKYQSAFGIKKMFTFGIGFKRDGDKVYWLTANGFGNFE